MTKLEKWWSSHYRWTWLLLVAPAFLIISLASYTIQPHIQPHIQPANPTVNIEPSSLLLKLKSSDIVSKSVKFSFSEKPLTVNVSLIGDELEKLVKTKIILKSEKLYIVNLLTNYSINNVYSNQTYQGFLKVNYEIQTSDKNETKNFQNLTSVVLNIQNVKPPSMNKTQ
jgi:hypothetical protein